jgi:hypothetical protein
MFTPCGHRGEARNQDGNFCYRQAIASVGRLPDSGMALSASGRTRTAAPGKTSRTNLSARWQGVAGLSKQHPIDGTYGIDLLRAPTTRVDLALSR